MLDPAMQPGAPDPVGNPQSAIRNPQSSSPHDPRRQARVLAMQALCCAEALGENPDAEINLFFSEADADLDTRVRARTLFDRARERRASLDGLLKQLVREWDVARMAPVDRNVIRVAEAELALAEAPPRVVINEAIEIAREYGSAESPAFVNGVLDALLKHRPSG